MELKFYLGILIVFSITIVLFEVNIEINSGRTFVELKGAMVRIYNLNIDVKYFRLINIQIKHSLKLTISYTD